MPIFLARQPSVIQSRYGNTSKHSHPFASLTEMLYTDKDTGKLSGDNHRITYSERVYIDVREILHLADKDSKAIVWRHLMWLSALMDPSGKAKGNPKGTEQR